MVPEHLREWWTQDLWCLHSAAWWRRHWERTGIMEIDLADTMPDGWRLWLDWHKVIAPDNESEITALKDHYPNLRSWGNLIRECALFSTKAPPRSPLHFELGRWHRRSSHRDARRRLLREGEAQVMEQQRLLLTRIGVARHD
jgi:hypothetical protein